MTLIIISLILGSIFGFHLIFNIYRLKPTPSASAIIHGLLAAVGLLVLFVQGSKWDNGTVYSIALILFIFSAVTGVALEFMTIDNSALKVKMYSLIHSIASASGLVLLILWTINTHNWGM